MPRIISGTKTLNSGNGVLEPTGTDRGDEFTKIIIDFMRQYAVHTHNGSDSLTATLPNRAIGYSYSQVPVETTDALGRVFYSYEITVPDTNIETIGSVDLYYSDSLTPTISDWKSLHCDYYITEQVALPNNMVIHITGLTKQLTSIKVIL